MSCEYCDMISGKKEAAKLYEDDRVIAFLSPQPATIGHIVVAPKMHIPIFEGMEEGLIEHTFKTANKISIALFEAIKCEGTNLIIQNGMAAGQEAPHFSVNLLARRGGDGFVFEWAPKQLSEEEMATVELQLKGELEARPAEKAPEPEREEAPWEKREEREKEGEKKEERPAEKEEAKGEKEEKKEEEEKEESYLTRQLKRMP
jgi:histidine triad (HIT) family protein